MPNKSAINLITAEISALESLLETIDDTFDHVTDLIVNCTGKIICRDELSTVPIYGCTDSDALNYNPQANTDDGSCEYPVADGGSIPTRSKSIPCTAEHVSALVNTKII